MICSTKLILGLVKAKTNTSIINGKDPIDEHQVIESVQRFNTQHCHTCDNRCVCHIGGH